MRGYHNREREWRGSAGWIENDTSGESRWCHRSRSLKGSLRCHPIKRRSKAGPHCFFPFLGNRFGSPGNRAAISHAQKRGLGGEPRFSAADQQHRKALLTLPLERTLGYTGLARRGHLIETESVIILNLPPNRSRNVVVSGIQ